MVLTFFTSDLLDLIIIEISSDNYQYKETSLREVEQTGSSHEPAGQGSFIATQPPLRAQRESPYRPRGIRSAPDLTSKPADLQLPHADPGDAGLASRPR